MGGCAMRVDVAFSGSPGNLFLGPETFLGTAVQYSLTQKNSHQHNSRLKEMQYNWKALRFGNFSRYVGPCSLFAKSVD